MLDFIHNLYYLNFVKNITRSVKVIHMLKYIYSILIAISVHQVVAQCSATITVGKVSSGDTDITDADKTVGDQNCTTEEFRVYNSAGTTTVSGITLKNYGHIRVMQGKLNLTSFAIDNNGGSATCYKSIEVDDGAELEITTTSSQWERMIIVNNGTLTINYSGTFVLRNQDVVVHNKGTINMYMDWLEVRDGCFFYNDGILNVGDESAWDTGNLEINNNGEKFCMGGGAAMNVKGYYKATNKEMIYYGGGAAETSCIRIANTASYYLDVDGNLNDPGAGVIDDPNGNITMCADDGAWNVKNGTSLSTGSSPQLTSCTAAECVALPIDLLSFTAENAHSGVEVRWSTAEELNNDFFSLEKSSDGVVFELVDIIPGQGNSFNVVEYEYHDHTPNYGVTYYRLSQTDYDGTEQYFDVITVDEVHHESYNFDIYPNPYTGLEDHITIEVYAVPPGGFEIVVYNVFEQEVYVSSIERVGPTKIPVPKEKGIYFVTLFNGDGEEVQKLVVE